MKHRPTMPVTLVCGVDPEAMRAVGHALLARDPHRALLSHCLDQTDLGLVSRTVEHGDGEVDPTVLELAHGCVSCTVREDAIPALLGLAQDGRTRAAVVLLPPWVEPITFLEAFHGVTAGHRATASCHVDAVLAVVAGTDLLATLQSDDELSDHGPAVSDLPNRTCGQALARIVETADVVFAPQGGAAALAAVRMLNPTAWVEGDLPRGPWPGVRTAGRAAGRTPGEGATPFRLDGARERADTSLIPAGAMRRRASGVWQSVWRARGPLHPGRLVEAIPEVVSLTVRSRGTIWLSTRADARVGWEGAGSRLLLGQVGSWIGDGGIAAWSAAPAAHRVRAQLEWHPGYADRYQELAFVGLGDGAAEVHHVLDRCLLTDAEQAAGPFGPPLLADPLAEVFESAGSERGPDGRATEAS